MAGGDLDSRAHPTQDDEFAELGRSLDQMAASLSQALSELRRERDLFSGVVERMHEGVLLLDRDGRVVLANPALRDMLLLRGDLVGQPLYEVVRQTEVKALLDRTRGSAAPVSDEIEVVGLKPRRLLVHAAPLAGEGGLQAVLFDLALLALHRCASTSGTAQSGLKRQ